MKKLILLTVIFFILLTNSCTSVRGSGNVVIEERVVQSITKVVISGQGQLILSQNDEESLYIEAEDNIMPLIETTISDDTLFIRNEAVATAVTTVPIKIHLTIKNIASLESAGLSQIHAANIEVDQLQIIGSGLGKIMIDSLTANKTIILLADDSNAELNGTVQSQEIDVSGHADYRAAELESQTVTVNIGGTGTATVWVEESINGIVNGNGDVLYYGVPETNIEVTDSGKVKSREK